MLPFLALNAVTAVGDGAAVDLQGVADAFCMQVQAPSAGVGAATIVQLQGSLDGTSFVALPSGQINLNDGNVHLLPAGPSYNSAGVVVPSPYVRYIRASVTQIGSATSVTAWVVAALNQSTSE